LALAPFRTEAAVLARARAIATSAATFTIVSSSAAAAQGGSAQGRAAER